MNTYNNQPLTELLTFWRLSGFAINRPVYKTLVWSAESPILIVKRSQTTYYNNKIRVTL